MARKARKGKGMLAAISSALGNEPDTNETVTQNMAESAEPVADVVVEDVVATLEALEGETTEVTEPTTAPSDAPAQDFDAVLAAVSRDDVDAKLAATVAAIRERKDFELVKDASNTKIQKTLNKVHNRVCTKRAARLLCATNVDPSILNRVIHEGARYNVYAMDKLGDAIWGLTNNEMGDRGKISNAINLACMKSLFRFRAASVQYSGEMAKCSASDKIRIDRAVSEMLVRHTVSASTAPTQASSTMQALETLGIVRRSGSGKNPNFDLTANPIVGKLEAVLAA